VNNRNIKQDLFGMDNIGWGKAKGECEGVVNTFKILCPMDGNRTMKPVEIVL
jgi:hypothetical protein